MTKMPGKDYCDLMPSLEKEEGLHVVELTPNQVFVIGNNLIEIGGKDEKVSLGTVDQAVHYRTKSWSVWATSTSGGKFSKYGLENQDAMAGCGNVFAIADGMGGVRDENGQSASAEVARKAVSAAVSQLLDAEESQLLDLDALRDLRAAVPGGSTLLTAKIEKGHITVNSLGDCQLIVIDGKDGKLKGHVPPAN